jgi:glycine/D-amino acid oxidase-like deaminating enzyme
MSAVGDQDVVVIGGGFYGLCVALFLRSVYRRVIVLERASAAMTRASAVNQARVHAGFHYPRSFVTALRSVRNVPRFTELFADAIVDDFTMLYAIARRDSKVTANRFERMFTAMGTRMTPANAGQWALFDTGRIEAVFACSEFAFDWTRVRAMLLDRIADAGIEMRCDTEVRRIYAGPGGPVVVTGSGDIPAGVVVNATYSEINTLLLRSRVARFSLKHEWTEMALIEPPEALLGNAVTVMDGPFFSAMPYPAAGLWSLTHVRHTPHFEWTEPMEPVAPSTLYRTLPRDSRWYHMVADARRFVPSIQDAVWRESLYEVKTVLTRNESDDGRPILLQRHDDLPGLYSVLGGKIDNIFDLFEAMCGLRPEWGNADLRYLAVTG